MNVRIPNEADWESWQGDLDSAYAHDKFVGKTLVEAEELFASAPLGQCENLDYMPRVPFQYYVHAMKNYLLSEASRDEPDGASCFLRLILRKLQHEPALIRPVMPSLLDAIRTIAERQVFYDANFEIYGDFKDLLKDILDEYDSCK